MVTFKYLDNTGDTEIVADLDLAATLFDEAIKHGKIVALPVGDGKFEQVQSFDDITAANEVIVIPVRVGG